MSGAGLAELSDAIGCAELDCCGTTVRERASARLFSNSSWVKTGVWARRNAGVVEGLP